MHTPDTDTAAPVVLSRKAFKAGILRAWLDLGDLMRQAYHTPRDQQRPDDHHLGTWGIDQHTMADLLDDLDKDSRRHRRAPGAPHPSDWFITNHEDSRLMVLRFVARATPGPWAPSADWTRWGAYGDAIGAVLGDRRPAAWLELVATLDRQPRFAGHKVTR